MQILDFVKNLFSKCNTTNDFYNVMCLFNYLREKISYEEMEIIIQHLMPIGQVDKIDQQLISKIASIVIALLKSSPDNKRNEIAIGLKTKHPPEPSDGCLLPILLN